VSSNFDPTIYSEEKTLQYYNIKQESMMIDVSRGHLYEQQLYASIN